MNKTIRRTPPRWLYFVIGVGALIACGIYVGTGAAEGFTSGRIARAVMFGVLGLLWVFQYGQGRRSRRHENDSSPGPGTRDPGLGDMETGD
jgi:hypothetical protein